MSNRTLVENFLQEVQASGTPAAIQKYGTEDFIWWSAGRGEIQDQAVNIEAMLAAHLVDGLKIEIVATTCEGNRVAVEAKASADFKSGAQYRNEYHFLFVTSDGKIRMMKEYHDTLHAAQIIAPIIGG